MQAKILTKLEQNRTCSSFANRKQDSLDRYMNGARINPNFDVAVSTMLQIKNNIVAPIELRGKAYVFLRGRKGHYSLLNTNMKFELQLL
jgi:xylose isomerase